MKTENQELVQEIVQLGAYQLAQLAGTKDPKSQDSPGAVFLKSIRDSIIEFYQEGDLNEQSFNEITSNSPSIWYHEIMDQYVDLELYRETDLKNYSYRIEETEVSIMDIAATELSDAAYLLGQAIVQKLGVTLD
jgi:hypothetical protein